MTILVPFVGVPLLSLAFFASWEAFFRILSFVAGTAVTGLGFYVGYNTGSGKVDGRAG